MPETKGAYTTDSEARLDAGSFFSSILGFGKINEDKLETFSVGRRARLTPEELYELYGTNNFIANVIDSVPDAACQKWCEYGCDRDPEKINEELTRFKPHANQGWKLARLLGWAAVVMLIDDGVQDYSQPVNARGIRGISGYNVQAGGEGGEISVFEYDDDPFSLTYGQPQLFAIAGSDAKVHVSRLLLFYGVKQLSSLRGRSLGQPGTSVIDRCYQEFRNFDVANNSVAMTLPDFNVDVLSIPGLAQMLAKQKDFKDFIAGMAFARRVLKVQLVEAGSGGQNAGGYQILQRSYTGVTELLNYFKQIFAGATDLNHTQLFGESPEGQTSGKYQMRSFAQYIHNQQESVLRPELEKLLEYLHLANGGVPQKWKLNFPSILELDEEEEADIELKQAQRLGVLVDKQVVTPDECAKSLSEGIDIGQAIDLEQREREQRMLEQFPEGVGRVPGVKGKPEEGGKNEP